MKIKPKHLIDEPPGKFDRRVFIGGNYNLGSRLEDIAIAVDDCEFTPILVWNFGIPPNTERQTSKLILQKCKYAIFEVSSDSGYFFEMDDAEDGSLPSLCVWDSHQGAQPRISAMVKSHPIFIKNNRSYGNNRQLYYAVCDFLKNLKML